MGETQIKKVKDMLEAAGSVGVTNAQFLRAFVPRFSAHILTLRNQGHNIQTECERAGLYRYTLIRPRAISWLNSPDRDEDIRRA